LRAPPAPLAHELAPAQCVHLFEEVGVAIAGLGALERRGIDAGAVGELLDATDEVSAPGHNPPFT
jgi:hypothetical protein